MPDIKDHSVFNNQEIKDLMLPTGNESWITEAEGKARSGGEKNVYKNLLAVNKRKAEEKDVEKINGEQHPRNVFIMRHAERIDITFGSWLPFCYDKAGNYIQRDLNLPKDLPSRKEGPKGYLWDSPLTNMGIFTASMVGEAVKEKNISIDSVYCSPSFRCVQTCDAFLAGLNKKELKIKIEPGLFEWVVWYQENLPHWMTTEELIKAGYNIDEDYKPFVTEKELRELEETCEQFYLRSAFVSRAALSATTGNILLVGHSATLDTCSHELIGKEPKSEATEMIKFIREMPYCSLVQVTSVNGKWEIVKPPTLPLTYSANQRFDWKMLLNE